VKKKFNRYRLHLFAGVLLFPFLLISATTGFFRANSQWFWKADYKKVKNTSFATTLGKPQVTLDSVFEIATRRIGSEVIPTEIVLRAQAGRMFYDVRSAGKPSVLIDAATGEILSPITPAFAALLASQYVKAGTVLKKIYKDPDYKTRKEKKQRSVYIAEYADALHTKIFLDSNNGEIEEETDDNLAIGMLMVKLHDYDFWNTKRITRSLVGAGLTLVGLSGFYIWLRKKSKKKNKLKATRTASAGT
jgi:uncharacterized iron-regulated membrane protein